MSVYGVIGEVFLILIVLLLIFLGMALVFGIYLLKRKKEVFPRFTFLIISSFYRPLKLLLSYFRIDPNLVNEIGIALMNSFSMREYANTLPERRILFLPQCLRDIKCQAPTTYSEGVVCLKCGRCEIAKIKKKCEEIGIGVYIVIGSSFVKRIINEKKPEATIGVACSTELYEVMRYVISRGIPAIGILLRTSGCVMTDVNWEMVERFLTFQGEGE
ncbi:MAG: DUF116 domain-containing protein [Candidatus Syntropharchaeia archaeon]